MGYSKSTEPENASPEEQTLLIHDPLPTSSRVRRTWNWWLAVSFNIVLLLVGQCGSTLLIRYYYYQGGNSKWLETATFSVAFPILYIPLLFFRSSSSQSTYKPPLLTLALTYIGIGLINVIDNLMYSYALSYLPVSTYSLVCATQLAFNAVFSYFINSEKFTHLTLNSVILLTFSAAIIGINHEPGSASVDSKYIPLGFILALGASATYSLMLSLMQLAFDKVIKSQNFSDVLNMQIYIALASAIGSSVGLWASGEWRTLKGEMEGFKKGRVVWVMILMWSSVMSQVANVGVVGLIFEVSSLFTNVISTLALPIVPLFAVILFGDQMDGMKVISLLLALWGFTSYFYQHYLDYKREEKERMIEGEGEVHYAQ